MSTTTQCRQRAGSGPPPVLALRDRFRRRSTTQMLHTATRLRIGARWPLDQQATATALRALAHRALAPTSGADAYERDILAIVRSWRPDLLTEPGVGAIVAATVLCAWPIPAASAARPPFAALAGASPHPASSGMTVRHRLNRSGDRQLNRALNVVVLCRPRHDPTTRAYAEQHHKKGETDREIKRCLNRDVARTAPPAPRTPRNDRDRPCRFVMVVLQNDADLTTDLHAWSTRRQASAHDAYVGASD